MKKIYLFFLFALFKSTCQAQNNLLLNGGFEDVNVCTEYSAECGVEAWFYLKDVKAQMLGNDDTTGKNGTNSFGIFFNWSGDTEFSPLIGTLLPCKLQAGKEYIFKGLISAKLNPKLLFVPGICMGPFFYVPRRKFALDMHADSVTNIRPVPNSLFYQMEYRFIAKGDEKYLTFGTYVTEDTVGGKKKLTGVQTVSVVFDNFQLLPADSNITCCPAFEQNKKTIYNYNFRHRDMDYSLFGRGYLDIKFNLPPDSLELQVQKKTPPPLSVIIDTLRLDDVLFDFNKSVLKPDAEKILSQYFLIDTNSIIDSMYVEGHTDAMGSDSSNMVLGKQRSEQVKWWLINHQIAPESNIHTQSFGKARPIATNKTPEGRTKNRRVEIIIFRRRK